MAVSKTESDFGLIRCGDRVSADGGKTYLPKYADMTVGEFEALVWDIESWLDERLSQFDRRDLEVILR
jgi:hypothetical protein